MHLKLVHGVKEVGALGVLDALLVAEQVGHMH